MAHFHSVARLSFSSRTAHAPAFAPSVLPVLVALWMGAAAAMAAEKPTVYNHIIGESSALDAHVRAALSPKFKIVDVRKSEGYVPAKVTAGRLPRIARTDAGEVLGGSVLLAYVVTVEGRVAEPVVLKSSDKRLNRFVTGAVDEWRFAPATLEGKAIASTAAQEFDFAAAPTKFVEQVLEPTGGKISRPKDWFYAEGHRGSTYDWTISRENAAGGKRYTTGVRIQTFTGVKAGAGKSARQFILDFAAAKKKDAAKVIEECEPKDQEFFTRMCLETEEGPYHILYSLFWGKDDLDVAVVIMSGTAKELWEVYAPTFDKMSAFELIDMKRLGK